MNFGLLGCGQVAYFHAEAMKQLGHQVIAASATSANSSGWLKIKNLFPQAAFFADGKNLIANTKVDSLVCALPWDMTDDWLPDLFASSKPMLIEKPIGLDVDRLRRWQSDFQNNLSNKCVGFNRRSYQSVEVLKQRLGRGGLKSATVTISVTIDNYVDRFGVKIIPYLHEFYSSHSIDLMNYFFGETKILKSYKYPQRIKDKNFDSFHALLETASGAPIFFQLNGNDSYHAGFIFKFDDETTWELCPLEELRVYKGYDIVLNETTKVREFYPKTMDEILSYDSCKPGFLKQLERFVSGDFEKLAGIPDSLRISNFLYNLRST